jgi:hypothetical protein
MINNNTKYTENTKKDIARLTLIHSGVLIYDSEVTDSGNGKVINNKPHYGEYATVWINNKLPAALRCAADCLYNENRLRWNEKKAYIKSVFETVLRNIWFYNKMPYEKAVEPKEILEGIFANDTPSTVDQENVNNYIVNFGYNFADLTNLYEYRDFDGKSIEYICELYKNQNDAEYLSAVNMIFIDLVSELTYVDEIWDYKNTPEDIERFTKAVADMAFDCNKVSKEIFNAA